jgi:hypothetical protein
MKVCGLNKNNQKYYQTFVFFVAFRIFCDIIFFLTRLIQVKKYIDSLSEISPKYVLQMAEFAAHLQRCDKVQANKHQIRIGMI